eukprot:UN24079
MNIEKITIRFTGKSKSIQYNSQCCKLYKKGIAENLLLEAISQNIFFVLISNFLCLHPKQLIFLTQSIKNRSITKIHSFVLIVFFFENIRFFFFLKISKNRSKFQRIFLKFFIFSSPNLLNFQLIFHESNFPKNQILKQVQNGPVNRDKKKC